MHSKETCLIVGLGNPGDTYEMTRHNIGFMIIDHISDVYNIPIKKKNRFNAEFGHGFIEDIDVIVAKPMAYMNRSGLPVYQIAQYFNIECNNLLVIHDDIDITFGILKIKEKGGHGGHKGLKSLIEVFHGGNFKRFRIGIGRPEPGASVTEYVLGRFNIDEKIILDQIITRAQDAIVTVLCKGIKHGMNRFNNKRTII